jgi:hypothetical protein
MYEFADGYDASLDTDGQPRTEYHLAQGGNLQDILPRIAVSQLKRPAIL